MHYITQYIIGSYNKIIKTTVYKYHLFSISLKCQLKLVIKKMGQSIT